MSARQVSGDLSAWLTDDEVVFYGDGFLAENCGGSGDIDGRARCTPKHYKWRLVGEAFVASFFGNAGNFHPHGDVPRVYVAAERTRFFIAMRDDAANVDIEEVGDGCAAWPDCGRPRVGCGVVCLGPAGESEEKKHIHVGAVVEDSIWLDELKPGEAPLTRLRHCSENEPERSTS